ncbi:MULTISPECIES: hypothetical protein [Clostridium]|nr:MULTISPECIES: hypothetical protein [Clostridium]MDU1349191.1 hypothetical protein [Clostridium argentinense]
MSKRIVIVMRKLKKYNIVVVRAVKKEDVVPRNVFIDVNLY